jgi:2-oxoglutarate ferredoxin oxidoreductase subunit alpha
MSSATATYADTEVLMAGFGGQGTLLAGKVLAQATLDIGREVSWLPSYGPEMRGGTANVIVCMATKPIGSPLIESPRGLIVMNLPSLEKFAPKVRPGGVIIVNSSLIDRDPHRDDCTVVKVPSRELAQGRAARAANFVMSGYIGTTHAYRPRRLSMRLKRNFGRQKRFIIGRGCGVSRWEGDGMSKVLMKGTRRWPRRPFAGACIFRHPSHRRQNSGVSRQTSARRGRAVQAESRWRHHMVYALPASDQMYASSSPGISLMAEGMSYLAACELPCVIINIMRAGPGLGGILPSQADYFQATKGHGHGDYQLIVLAPASVQEAVDLMTLAFELAEKYRNPVMLCADGMIGQMMEPVEFPGDGRGKPFAENTWELTGAKGRPRRIVNSLFLAPEQLFQHNIHLKEKYDRIARDETRSELYGADQPYDLMLVAFGTMARICKTAIDEVRRDGLHVALFRPITLNPYPMATARTAMDAMAPSGKC